MRDQRNRFRTIAGTVFLAGLVWFGGSADGQTFATVASPSITALPAGPLEPTTVGELKAIQVRVEAVVKEAMPATVAILAG